MVLDGESLLLAPRAAELIAASDGAALPGTLKSELFASALELNTNICATADEAAQALAELRRAATALAEERGLRLAAAGSHPISRPGGPGDRRRAALRGVRRLRGRLGAPAGVSGLHVHVGMESADACFHALEGVLPWLPVVLALSANSPYLAGEETGMMSNRAEVLAQLPRAARRRPFARMQNGKSSSSASERSGWRPTTRASGGTSAHIRDSGRSRSACRTSRPRSSERRGSSPCSSSCAARCSTSRSVSTTRLPRGLYQQNRWAAARFGLAAELFHPDGEHTAKAARARRGARRRREAGRVVDRGGAPARGRTLERPRGCLRRPRRANARLEAWPSRPRRCR